MTKKLRAYYAHSYITETHGAASIVENILQRELPEIEIVNPFFVGDKTERWLSDKGNLAVAKEIVRTDVELMNGCDLIISYFPDIAGTIQLSGGIGTPMEIWYFRYTLNRPVYALTPFIHPWLMALEVKASQDIFELCSQIRREMRL